MPIDPPLLALVSLLDGFPPSADEDISPADLRARATGATATPLPPEFLVPVGSVEDRTLDGPGGELPVRIYRPDASGPSPTVVFFHGGGFVLCNLDSHDSIAREICRRCDAVVVSVDYRLAPEDPFPAAVDDAVWAVRWAAEHVAELGNDPRVLAVAGDSAGGNLSAVVAQQLRDTGGPPLAAQLLMYPVVDMRDDVEQRYLSMREHSSDGILLTADFMRWFQSNYATAEQAGTDPRCSPIVALDLSGLPDAVIVTAEYDPLRDSGEAYAAALADAGVKVDLRRFDSIIHGFFSIGLLSPLAQAAVEETCALFRDALRREA